MENNEIWDSIFSSVIGPKISIHGKGLWRVKQCEVTDGRGEKKKQSLPWGAELGTVADPGGVIPSPQQERGCSPGTQSPK